MNVMMVVAHPDEGEIYTGGVACLLSSLGHRVKFLSLTNGDAGHYEMAPEALAKIRRGEAMEAKEILGLADYEILDYHDQYLEDTAQIRAEVAERVRAWVADLVFSYYPIEGGHVDNMRRAHRARGGSPVRHVADAGVSVHPRLLHRGLQPHP